MKKIIGICGLALMFLLGACGGATISSAANNPRSIEQYSPNYVVDEATGVNYIVISLKGYCEYTIAITPRLNADGSLYVTT